MTEMSSFSWDNKESNKDGSDLPMNMMSNPTLAALIYKREQGKVKGPSKERESLLSRYGGGEHLDVPAIELLIQSEDYTEYDRAGDLIKGTRKAPTKSKYPEDIFSGNHTQVWGSWYDGAWGYGCCQGMLRSAYCGGQIAIDAKVFNQRKLQANIEKAARKVAATMAADKLEKKIPFDEVRLKGTFFVDADAIESVKNKRRKDEMNQDELEVYRMNRHRKDDPMSGFNRE